MKTKAAVLDASGAARPYKDSQPLRLAELELAPPKAHELLVRIDAAGLCHSDLSVVNGDRPRPTPMALGHEACGTVVATGPDVTRFATGDRVVLAFLPACGTCVPCQSGEGWLCANGAAANGKGELLGGGCRLSEGDHAVHHHMGLSAFATHAVIDERSAVKIDDGVPPEIAALFGCAVLTGVGAVFNTAKIRPGQSVAIWGLGGVGLAALLGAKAAGAEPIFAMDPNVDKCRLALALGARHAVHPDGAQMLIRANTNGGTDFAIESVGSAKVLAEAYRLTCRGGVTVTVGLPNPAEELTIPAVSLVADAKTLMGSYMGSSIPARDIPRYIALWKAGRLPVERLLSAKRPMAEINAALDDLASGAAVRQILLPPNDPASVSSALAGLVGLLIGSFIGVLTLRWPAGEGFITGRSRCDLCRHELSARDLVPVLSHAALAGKCRHCGGRIAPRHLAIELAAAGIGALALALHPGAEGWAGAVFGWALLALAILDAEHFWLPDALTLPLLAAGLLLGLWLAPPLAERAIGALAGWTVLMLVALGYRLVTGREGLGGGDPKLLAAIGAWLGWLALGPVLLGASIIGLGAALLARLAGRAVSGRTQLPLGTLMALAAWPVWLLGLPPGLTF